MKKTFTQSMAWLHTWSGLLFGWPLFAIFLTGTLAVFDQELDHWMQPEIHSAVVAPAAAAQRGVDYLSLHNPTAPNWGISLPSDRSPGMRVTVGDRRQGVTTQLDPQTGEQLDVRESVGGNFFFRFHYTLHLPRLWGIYTVGVLAMLMLVGLVTGIVIHKKIFKEFFTFRPNKGQRSWLDFHNASAVLLLPFHLMITYTGLVIFMILYMPAAVDALFEGKSEDFYKALGNERVELRREGLDQPAALVNLGPLLAEAQARIGPVGGLNIRNAGTAAAVIEARPLLGNRIALSKGQSIAFDGVTGELLRDSPQMGASMLTQRVMTGLHFAQFGGYPMRWLYFLCGLISTAMIGSGLVLFCVKRRRKYATASLATQRWHRLAETLNVAVVGGLMLACIGLLWASRLLPAELANREDWETRVFFGVWIATVLHASVRSAQRAWCEQLGLTAALCIGLPLLGALTAFSDPTRRMVESISLVIGVMLVYAAWRCVAPQVDAAPSKRRQTALETE